MKPTLAVLHADAGAAALIDALKNWRQDHAPQAAYEALMAEHIRTIHIDTRIQQGARSLLTIHVYARERGKGDQYYYEAEVAAGELKLHRITR